MRSRRYKENILPGQGTSLLQAIVSLGSPLHNVPPYLGAGESHSRVRDCWPCLHVLLHALQELHFPQVPSTNKTNEIDEREYMKTLYLNSGLSNEDVSDHRS